MNPYIDHFKADAPGTCASPERGDSSPAVPPDNIGAVPPEATSLAPCSTFRGSLLHDPEVWELIAWHYGELAAYSRLLAEEAPHTSHPEDGPVFKKRSEDCREAQQRCLGKARELRRARALRGMEAA